MIDQESRATFRAQYKQFAISLQISAEDVLSIAVENAQTLERYSRELSYEYIMQQDTFFQTVFEEAKNIYDYLKAEINEVLVDGQFLVFNYRHGNNRVKRIKIQLIREDIDRVELANLKMEKMQEGFTTQLLQKDLEIRELKQKDEEITQTLLQMIDKIRAEKAQNRQLVKTLRVDFQLIKDELQIEKANSRELEQTLKAHTKKTEIDFKQVRGQLLVEKKKSTELAATLRANSVKSEIEIKQIKKELQAEKDKRIELAVSANNEKEALAPLIPIVQDLNKMVKLFYKIDHHPNNAHKEYFALNNLTKTSARITRIGDQDNYNFVNKQEVLPNQKAKYSLTINKTKSSWIMIGFCTEKGLGNTEYFRRSESAYYSCGTGALWQGGSRKQIGVSTVIGETVECVADLANFKLSWWKKGSQIAECLVPTEMRNKPIYISIILWSNVDEVGLYV